MKLGVILAASLTIITLLGTGTVISADSSYKQITSTDITSSIKEKNTEELNLTDTHPDPLYRIIAVILPASEQQTRAGKELHPTLYITNEGGNDTRDEKIAVNAYLGPVRLIPVEQMIDTLKSGETKEYQLKYTIPATSPSHGYQLLLRIEEEKYDFTKRSSVEGSTTNTIIVRSPAPPVGGCGCS